MAASLRPSVRALASAALLSLSLGIATGTAAEQQHLQDSVFVESLPPDRFVTLTAPVDTEWVPSRDAVRTRVDEFEIETSDGETRRIGERLSIYAPPSVPPIGECDSISLEGFLRRSTDGRFYVSVKSARLVEVFTTGSPWHPHRWNRKIRGALERHVAVFPEHARAVALIRAVALGDGSSLSAEIRDSYRRGGTYHLLVFSGMQIAFAAAIVTFLLRLMRLGQATDASLVVLALLAPLFAGNDPSVSRASTMLAVYGFSRLLRRPTPMPNLLFLSATIRLAMNPDELSSPGFLLTYAATFGLVVVGASIARLTTRPAGMTIAYGLGAELCTQPLTLLFFRHYAIGGFAITLLLAPTLGSIILLSVPIAGALAIGSDLAWPLLELVSLIDRLAVMVNEVSSCLRLTGIAPAPPGWLVAACFLMAWSISISRLKQKTRALAIIVCLATIPLSVAWRGHLEAGKGPSVEILDVGQGDSILVRAGRTMLVDGGGSPGDPEFGRRTLIPLLADRGITRIDVVAMSHPDIDHCGGLLSVVRTVPVEEIWISPRHLGELCTRELIGAAPRSRIRFLRDGDEIEVGELKVEITVPRLRYKNHPINNGSVLMTAKVGAARFLLTGDIERDAELDLVDEAGGRLEADVLKVPHHGSRTSTSEELLEAVRPRVAVISCALDNLYGHPAPEVLARLRAHSIHVIRTDRSGSVRMKIVGSRIRLTAGEAALEVPLTGVE